MATRGALIVVEGLDRAGKTTQCSQLLAALHRQRARYQKFPDRTTPIGQMIHNYLIGQSDQDDHSIHLLFAANRWELAKKIRNGIEEGVTFIVDRYSYSGAVYSASKDNPDLSLKWAWESEAGLPRPDLLLFLSISPEEAARRGGYGEERYETDTMQKRVRSLFGQVLDMKHSHEIYQVDAGSSVEDVNMELCERVMELFSSDALKQPLGKLGTWEEMSN